jgi:hypothetical protein
MLSNMGRRTTYIYFFLVLVFSIIIGFAYLMKLWMLNARGLSPYSGTFPEWDYSNLWTGGKLALAGRPLTVFDVDAYRNFISAIADARIDAQEWSYPPSLLLIAAPLATIPLFPSYLVWTFGGIGLLYYVLRNAALPLALCISAALSPAMFTNVLLGQNGSLSAAFLCGGLLMLRRSPIVAGVLFGLLTFKPQLGVLVPICLLANRQWSAIAAAVVTATSIAIIAALCFGLDSWSLFFSRTVPMMRDILNAPYPQSYQVSCVSVFMFVRSLDGSLTSAWICQGLATLLAAGFVWWIWRAQRTDDWARIAATIIVTFLATPYAYVYDLVSYCIAISILAYLMLGKGVTNDRPYLIPLIVLLWFWPELQNAAIKNLYYQVSAIVIVIASCLAIAYCHFFDEPRLRLRSSDSPLALT